MEVRGVALVVEARVVVVERVVVSVEREIVVVGRMVEEAVAIPIGFGTAILVVVEADRPITGTIVGVEADRPITGTIVGVDKSGPTPTLSRGDVVDVVDVVTICNALTASWNPVYTREPRAVCITISPVARLGAVSATE